MRKVKSNSYEGGDVSAIGTNSVAFTKKDLVSMSGGFLIKAVAGWAIEWVCKQTLTMAADNQTSAQVEVPYEEQKEQTTYEIEAVWQVLLFDADLVASNTINLDVNGVAMTEVTFDTDTATTCAAIAAQLVTDFGSVIDATTASDWDRTINIVPVWADSTVVVTDIVVAAGASQADGAVTDTALAQTDEGKYFDITSGQKVSAVTAHATSWQLRMVKFVGTGNSEYQIVNT